MCQRASRLHLLGHPLLNVQSSSYWSASTNAADPTDAWFVDFTFFVWCVRGGGPLSEY